MWAVIRTDGTLAVHDDAKPSLEQMQNAVGGYIERVQLNRFDMYVDEEGKLKPNTVNAVATRLAHEDGAIWPNDVIAGPAVVIGHAGRGLTEKQTKDLIDIVARLHSWPPVGEISEMEQVR